MPRWVREIVKDPAARWRVWRGLAVYVLVKGEVPHRVSGSGSVVHVGITADLGKRVYQGLHTKSGQNTLPPFTRIWWRTFKDVEVERACEMHRRLVIRLSRRWPSLPGAAPYGSTIRKCSERVRGEKVLQVGRFRTHEKPDVLIPTREQVVQNRRADRLARYEDDDAVIQRPLDEEAMTLMQELKRTLEEAS